MTVDREASDDKPLIGADIPWKMVEGEVFRVLSFTPHATVDEAGNASAPPVPLPYAQMDVESPIFTQTVRMPVNHRVDFLNLRGLNRKGAMVEGHQLLVCYLPYRGFLGPLLRLGSAVLHLAVLDPSWAQDFFAEMDQDPKKRQKANRREFLDANRCRHCDTRVYSFMTRCSHCDRPHLAVG